MNAICITYIREMPCVNDALLKNGWKALFGGVQYFWMSQTEKHGDQSNDSIDTSMHYLMVTGECISALLIIVLYRYKLDLY